jgi:hypothetical protein
MTTQREAFENWYATDDAFEWTNAKDAQFLAWHAALSQPNEGDTSSQNLEITKDSYIKFLEKSSDQDFTFIKNQKLQIEELEQENKLLEAKCNELETVTESQKLILAEQLLIIKGFTLECESMGTTDIITALSRKDTQIAEITRLNYLVASLKETIEIMQDIIDTEKLKGVE